MENSLVRIPDLSIDEDAAGQCDAGAGFCPIPAGVKDVESPV
jgi:hypothetical protein